MTTAVRIPLVTPRVPPLLRSSLLWGVACAALLLGLAWARRRP